MSRRGHEGAVTVPARPVIELVLDEQGCGTVDGRLVPIENPEDPQASLLAEAVRRSRSLGRPVRVRALDPERVVWHLVAHPDGTVSELGDREPGAADAALFSGSGCCPNALPTRVEASIRAHERLNVFFIEFLLEGSC